jgi:nijmegen breakage syndrome protein 1
MPNTQQNGQRKVVWIIDAAYMRKAAPVRFDWLKLKSLLEGPGGRTFDEVYYLDSHVAQSSQERFHNWLRLAPPTGPKFQVRLYDLKKSCVSCPMCNQDFDRTVQKGVDVGIATLIFRLAVESRYERLLLSTGDGDFEDAISYVKTAHKKEVYIAAFRGSVSACLQSHSDKIVWLNDHINHFKVA